MKNETIDFRTKYYSIIIKSMVKQTCVNLYDLIFNYFHLTTISIIYIHKYTYNYNIVIQNISLLLISNKVKIDKYLTTFNET